MDQQPAKLSKDLEYQYLMEGLNASVSKHLLDEHFTLVAANDRYYELFGYTKEEYERRFHNRPDLFFKDSPDEWNNLCAVVIDALENNKGGYEYIGRMKHKNGTKLWIRITAVFIDEYVNGSQISYSIMSDMTSVMQTKIEKDVIQDNFPGLIAKYRLTKDSLSFLDGNQSFYDFFNQKRSFHLEDLKTSEALHEVIEVLPLLRQGKNAAFTISPTNHSKEQCFLKIHAQCIDWVDNDPVYLLIYTDVTEITKKNKQLEEYNQTLHTLAFSDEITKGFNRRKFDLAAGERIRSAVSGTYSVIWLNLQKFKLLNDIGGVEAGDRALIYIYRKIKAHLLDEECLTRIFSDNFVILLKTIEPKVIEDRLNTMIQDINSYNDQNVYKYYLTFSAGIYHINDPKMPVTSIEDYAHAALKNNDSIKEGMCLYHYYTDTIRTQMLDEKNIENRMREALKNKEFEVYLQPKYEVETNTIAGAEALIRWNDPQYGLIPPNDFIPLFESNGFIIQLDLFVFENVCQLLARWLKEGHSLIPISVNMSRLHFKNKDFIKRYKEIRDDYQVPSQYLEIELTETMVFENPQAFMSIIDKIHEAGFTCSMDDFGSGYSSLNTLKNINVDSIKLDKAFFSSQKMENKKENIIIQSMLEMAKALQMTTIAEGIETREQVEFLRHSPCHLIQGYYFSKPLPIPSFETLYLKK
ncbi:sensor domain-containing protein [Beduini massiliensis]|uniref:sensor domain-containing protein n=1 Tax=Beduini massiliensis TaxID=1585974 RepID=UPI00059AA7D9|nr:EAL domain-containing protein [Beduini massiliensis]